MSDELDRAWLTINFGDDMSGISFEAMLRLAASGARVAATLGTAPTPAEVQVVMVFEDADGPFELTDVFSSRSKWVLEARVGWRSVVADTDEESDWKVLSYVSAALLAAHAERDMPLGLVNRTPLADLR